MSKQTTNFPHLQAASDREAYNFIKGQSLLWIRAVEKEIEGGKTPQQIADWWGDEYGRDKMAKRIFHAARHIFRERSGDK